MDKLMRLCLFPAIVEAEFGRDRLRPPREDMEAPPIIRDSELRYRLLGLHDGSRERG